MVASLRYRRDSHVAPKRIQDSTERDCRAPHATPDDEVSQNKPIEEIFGRIKAIAGRFIFTAAAYMLGCGISRLVCLKAARCREASSPGLTRPETQVPGQKKRNLAR